MKNGLANVNSTATVNAWWWDTQARRWQSLGSQTINGAANPLCPWGWVNQMCFEFTGVPRNHKVYVTVKYQGDKTVRNRQKTLGSWRDLDMGGFTDK